MYRYEGKIVNITDSESVTPIFTTRFVVVVDESRKEPLPVAFQAINDDCHRLDDLKIGDKVSIWFTPTTNSFKGKYYTNNRLERITAWE